MKVQLLDPNGQKELVVNGIAANDYDLSYNFASKQLGYSPRSRPKKISTYIISEDLINAVNASLVTSRPLLLKGEPGCGKTKLAQAVASYFYGKEAYKYYYEWHVKSKSKAREGGYEFDHVGRLRDATITEDTVARSKAADPANYVTLGPLGNAFSTMAPAGKRPILLIDEIDKGDIDFPNDLLLELDEMRFKINEIPGTYISAPSKMKPLVFITSNNERELPPAFLRRCLYYYIPPFEKKLLVKIATSKLTEFYDELGITNPREITDKSMDTFVEEFRRLKENTSGKPPSTSELLDWLKLLTFHLHHDGATFDDLVKRRDLQSIALKLNA